MGAGSPRLLEQDGTFFIRFSVLFCEAVRSAYRAEQVAAADYLREE